MPIVQTNELRLTVQGACRGLLSWVWQSRDPGSCVGPRSRCTCLVTSAPRGAAGLERSRTTPQIVHKAVLCPATDGVWLCTRWQGGLGPTCDRPALAHGEPTPGDPHPPLCSPLPRQVQTETEACLCCFLGFALLPEGQRVSKLTDGTRSVMKRSS